MEQTLAMAAQKMAIFDAIEKGHTCKKDMIAYMKSKVFIKTAKKYYEMLTKEFN